MTYKTKTVPVQLTPIKTENMTAIFGSSSLTNLKMWVKNQIIQENFVRIVFYSTTVTKQKIWQALIIAGSTVWEGLQEKQKATSQKWAKQSDSSNGRRGQRKESQETATRERRRVKGDKSSKLLTAVGTTALGQTIAIKCNNPPRHSRPHQPAHWFIFHMMTVLKYNRGWDTISRSASYRTDCTQHQVRHSFTLTANFGWHTMSHFHIPSGKSLKTMKKSHSSYVGTNSVLQVYILNCFCNLSKFLVSLTELSYWAASVTSAIS